MKKVLVILAAALVSVSAMAEIHFGAKVGFDMTNFVGKDADHGMAPNYQAGVVMEMPLTEKFAIAPEAVFAAQGGKWENAGVDITANVNYVNIPVMAKYYVTPAFAIDFGPQLGINVYSKTTSEAAGVKTTLDLKDNTKAIDFGVGLGGTYNLTENAFLQARYTLGLTDVYDGGGDAKNGNIQVAFGWKF